MSINKWDERFCSLAAQVAVWSKDPERRVGAVLVDAKRRVVGVGFNGFPRGMVDTDGRLAHPGNRLLMTVHAEVNAILNSAWTEGSTLYCTSFPCAGCAGIIIQAGIIRVVSMPLDLDPKSSSWSTSWEFAKDMMMEAGVRVNEI